MEQKILVENVIKVISGEKVRKQQISFLGRKQKI